MNEKLQKCFLSVSVLCLLITGIAKVLSSFGTAKALLAADPFFGISFKQMFLTVGVLEIVICAIVIFAKSRTLALSLIAWLSSNFLIYRVALYWTGWKKPCSCMGSLSQELGLAPEIADLILKDVLAFMLVGSYSLLLWRHFKGNSTKNGEIGLKITAAVD
jgi:hypothetical protein